NALVLLHDVRLWGLVDQWVAELAEAHFERVLPLVRRTFSAFNPAERRQLAEQAKQAAVRASPPPADAELDWPRAERILPTLRHILGLPS
ncbi:MAG: DUF5682 family protein, partial [Candidatus Methylumidiphilus sp.]